MGRRTPSRGVVVVALVTLVVLLATTVAATWTTHVLVTNQEQRLLNERTNEVGLEITTATGTLTSGVTTLEADLAATDDPPAAFDRVARPPSSPLAVRTALAIADPARGGYQVETETGAGLVDGQLLTGPRAAAAAAAAAARPSTVVSTAVVGSGTDRLIGLALALPATYGGAVLFEQLALGSATSPRDLDTALFRGVQVVVYDTPRPRTGQVVLTTTGSLPLDGGAEYRTVAVNGTYWLVGVDAVEPLIGTAAADAAWFVLVAGIVLSVLVALLVYVEGRRRAAALALYDSEHRVAETIQRSLLPALPRIEGLDLAARYLGGGADSQLGGDWFDVFPTDDGRVGFAIGDVAGHDLVAATAMSQVRATLRAYAWRGADPASVLDQLDRLVEAFALAPLVTVFYGILAAPGDDGGRALEYSNAGHPSPLVRLADGATSALDGVRSVVIGAESPRTRTNARGIVPAGATILAFTDGLVEVPGGSIEEGLRVLASTVAGDHDDGSADALCERVVHAMLPDQVHDDVAVLAIGVLDPRGAPVEEARSRAGERA